MPTLFLSAPKTPSQQGSNFYKDFYTILQNRIGPDYAIFAGIATQLQPGIKVVVFDRVRQLQAEGVISAVNPKPATACSGMMCTFPTWHQCRTRTLPA
jgi:hypothetical protein